VVHRGQVLRDRLTSPGDRPTGSSVAPSEGRHVTAVDAQFGSGLLSSTIWPPATPAEDFTPGCGVVWTHYTIRAWLAEILGWIGTDGRMLERVGPLAEAPGLEWIDP
jgi:hypothetical protein